MTTGENEATIRPAFPDRLTARLVNWAGGTPGFYPEFISGLVLVHSMHCVYFLKLSNGNIYKGSTADLKRRFDEHQRGKVRSTRLFRPLALIGYEAYRYVSDAERRERFLKTTEGRRLLRQQYRDAIQKKFSRIV